MFTFTRNLSSSNVLHKFDKYYKVTKYVKKIYTSIYKEGDIIDKSVNIPRFKQYYPDYPYETLFFKQQNRGLYGGLQKSSSKTCSESKNKNLRTHKPNIVKASLYSEILDKVFKLKVATKVLKTITKEGGLDNYVLKDKPARIKTMGKVAWRIRYDIMKKQQLQELNIDNSTENTVYHIDNQGRKLIVGRKKLLQALYPFVKVDSYEQMDYRQYLANYSYKTVDELVELLENYGYDLSEITMNSSESKVNNSDQSAESIN